MRAVRPAVVQDLGPWLDLDRHLNPNMAGLVDEKADDIWSAILSAPASNSLSARSDQS
jgi:hypothetical protein